MEDWDCVFGAVTQRFSLIVVPPDALTRRSQKQIALEVFYAGVLERARALDLECARALDLERGRALDRRHSM